MERHEKAGKASGEREAGSFTERRAIQPPDPACWLVAGNDSSRMETFTIDLAEGEEALPVFGSEEEVETYLGREVSGDGRCIRESRAGAFVPVLFECRARVGDVTLDPSPRMAVDGMVRLSSLYQKSLVRDLSEKGELEGAMARESWAGPRKGAPY